MQNYYLNSFFRNVFRIKEHISEKLIPRAVRIKIEIIELWDKISLIDIGKNGITKALV